MEDKQGGAEECLTKDPMKVKFHRNPLKTVTNAAKAIRKSPKAQKKSSKGKGKVALMKVIIFKQKNNPIDVSSMKWQIIFVKIKIILIFDKCLGLPK